MNKPFGKPNKSITLKLNNILGRLANPAITFYALLWLVVLLIIGTVAQKYLGLYTAQQKYFTSFIIEGLWVPLPGGKTIMIIILGGLIAKLFMPSSWKINKLATNVIHLGVILLIGGGFVSGIGKTEGALVIPEGEISNKVKDYYRTELAVLVYDTNRDKENISPITEISFSQSSLKPGNSLSHPAIPFKIMVLDFFSNIDIQKLEEARGSTYHGFSKNFRLVKKKNELKAEENLSGLNFRIHSVKEINRQSIEGNYVIFEAMPIIQTVNLADKAYKIILRPQTTYMPFQIELIDFIVTYHPGIALAKSYNSVVNIWDGKIKQRQTIGMNRPLRYKGWTIYQSAFINNSAEETTILAAVKNPARLFPYIAGIIISLGLLFHLFIRLPLLLGNRINNHNEGQSV